MLGVGAGITGNTLLWSPNNLFSAGQKGVWYDPSDLSSMFQDVAGETPVTAVGQSVGRINDKSGNGYHALQSVANARGVLAQDSGGRYYIACNADGDAVAASYLATGVDLSGTDEVTLATALQKDSDAAFSVYCELSTSIATNSGAFTLTAPNSAAANITFQSKGTTAALATKSGIAAPFGAVILGMAKISTPYVESRINDLSAVITSTTQGTGNYGNHTLYLFKRANATFPFTGRFYGITIRGSLSSEATLAQLKAYYKVKSGF